MLHFYIHSTSSIFYENHGLKLNDRLVCHTNGGSTLGVWNGISTNFRSLTEFDDLYAAPITKDFIGISSHKIGLSTTGGYVGLTTTTGLFFFTVLVLEVSWLKRQRQIF